MSIILIIINMSLLILAGIVMWLMAVVIKKHHSNLRHVRMIGMGRRALDNDGRKLLRQRVYRHEYLFGLMWRKANRGQPSFPPQQEKMPFVDPSQIPTPTHNGIHR